MCQIPLGCVRDHQLGSETIGCGAVPQAALRHACWGGWRSTHSACSLGCGLCVRDRWGVWLCVRDHWGVWLCVGDHWGVCSCLRQQWGVSAEGAEEARPLPVHWGVWLCVRDHWGVWLCVRDHWGVWLCVRDHWGVYLCVRDHWGVWLCVRDHWGVWLCVRDHRGVWLCVGDHWGVCSCLRQHWGMPAGGAEEARPRPVQEQHDERAAAQGGEAVRAGRTGRQDPHRDRDQQWEQQVGDREAGHRMVLRCGTIPNDIIFICWLIGWPEQCQCNDVISDCPT